ncbi:MAG: SDR family oxidoreductase [bacterium]|nr:SDR family oxidoreductase [bacterium]
MKKALVAGATGYLGRYIVKELKKQGYWVRALVRNEGKVADLKECIDEVYIGEVTLPESLENICEGIDVVISSVGITRQKDGMTFMDVDYQGNKNLLDAALAHKVSKFLYVSVINAHKIPGLKIIQAKERFVAALKESGIDYAVIRPTGFFSDMLEFLKMAKKGKVFLFGKGNHKMNPIHGADLAEVCVSAIDRSDREMEVGGPETLTFRRIAETAFGALNREAKISCAPMWLISPLLSLMRIFTSSKTYGPIEFQVKAMTMDAIGKTYGKETLKAFFGRNA